MRLFGGPKSHAIHSKLTGTKGSSRPAAHLVRMVRAAELSGHSSGLRSLPEPGGAVAVAEQLCQRRSGKVQIATARIDVQNQFCRKHLADPKCSP
jgi:hypothetical protein